MITGRLPPCKFCQGRPIIMGEIFNGVAIECENVAKKSCENVEFNTYVSRAMKSWVASNDEVIGVYLKCDSEHDEMIKDGKEDSAEEDDLLAKMDNIWYSMSKDQQKLVNWIVEINKEKLGD